MDRNDIRSGSTKARFNEQNSSVLVLEIVLISVAVGFYYSSWLYFGVIFFGFILCSVIRPLAIILAVALSALWGLIGYAIGLHYSHTASIVLAAIGLLAGLGAHMSAMQWVSDVSK